MLGLSSHGRALIFLALFQPLLYADDVSFFRNIIVEKGAQSSGAVCIACSITEDTFRATDRIADCCDG